MGEYNSNIKSNDVSKPVSKFCMLDCQCTNGMFFFNFHWDHFMTEIFEFQNWKWILTEFHSFS